MSITEQLQSLARLIPRPGADSSRNVLRVAWDVLSGVPGGKAVFSRLVGRAAPYSATIHATVTVLRADQLATALGPAAQG